MNPNKQLVSIQLSNEKEDLNYLSCLSFVGRDENVLLKNQIDSLFHEDEKAYWNRLVVQKRQESFLLGRVAGKRALAGCGIDLPFDQILIYPGIFNQPILKNFFHYEVSLTHSTNGAMGLAFPRELLMGIDSEVVEYRRSETALTEMTKNERNLVGDDPHQIMALWTAKEALSKALKCGLLSPFSLFEINGWQSEDQKENGTKYSGSFKNFKYLSFVSYLQNNLAVSIVFPSKLKVQISVAPLL